MWVWCGGRESVLSLVPPDIRLEFVKIDAQVPPTAPLPRYLPISAPSHVSAWGEQGHDLSVAKGLKSQMERVEHVMLECQVKAMYEGSATQEDVIAWFQSKVRAQQQQRQTFAQADHERCRNHSLTSRAFAEHSRAGGVA